jgi:O-antigen biosynthesis protein WbqV
VLAALLVVPGLAFTCAGIIPHGSPTTLSSSRSPVLASLQDLESVVAANKGRPIESIVVCERVLERETARALLAKASELGLSVQMVEWEGGAATLRPMDLSDLLHRSVADVDWDMIRKSIKGRRILVTGAGGSIGSQLCLLLANLEPERLILLDSSEYNLFTIDHDLGAKGYKNRVAALCNVRDGDSVRRWFDRERPEIVFHAAALKHVPMVEAHASEGALTNVLGTRNVAEACTAHGSHLVFVSTDKAVDPHSVMGKTKRLAEMYCQTHDQRLGSKVGRRLVVRLGNVLSSAGSVVPLFLKQLKSGGPLTVTDEKANRYFITIAQAAEFLVQAAAIGLNDAETRGGALVLEMGAPLSVAELARDMIRLEGKRPDIDVQLRMIGLRRGEKLTEQLVGRKETVTTTQSRGVRVVRGPALDLGTLERAIADVLAAARQGEDEAVKSALSNALEEQDMQKLAG